MSLSRIVSVCLSFCLPFAVLACGDGAQPSGASGSTSGGGGAGTGGGGGTGGEEPIVCTDQCRYIRAGASGAANGVDWANAWPDLPQKLERGLVYLVADGRYGAHDFADPASGTALITVRKATPTQHGTEAGWQPSYGAAVATFPEITFSSSHYVFDGARGGGPGAWNTGFGFEITRPAPTLCKDNGNLMTFSQGASYVTVKHVHMHAPNNDYPINGVKGVSGADHLTFSHDSIHTTFGPSFHIGSWTHAVIELSYMADVRSTGGGDPLCPDWHAEGISSIGTNDDITIRYNIWDRIDGTAVLAGVNQGASTQWKVYGNIFSRSVTTIAYYFEAAPSTNQQTMDNLEFYNNNIVNMPGASVGSLAIQKGTNNKVFNNIWYNNIANLFTISGAAHDNNFFAENRRVESCSPACPKDDEGAAGESSPEIKKGSPFVNGDGDPLTADFHLKAATLAGASLPAPFDRDPEGKKRGADGVFDRGAFEFGP